MGSTTGAARARFLYDGKKFKYGSIQESIAINVFNQERNVALLTPIFSVVDPSKSNELLKQLKGILFPEEKIEDLRYIKKSSDFFRKIRGKTINIMPAGGGY